MRSSVIKAPYIYTVECSLGNSADLIASMLQARSHFKNLQYVIYLSPRSTLMLFLSSHSVVNAFLNPYFGLTPAFILRFFFYLLSLPLSNCHVFLTSLSPFLVSFSHERLHAVFDIAIRGKAPLGNPERNQIQFASVMRYILIFLDIPYKKWLQNTISKLPVPLYPI